MGIGTGGGLLVGLTSVGGGTIIMALLIVLFSQPLHEMVGLDVTPCSEPGRSEKKKHGGFD